MKHYLAMFLNFHSFFTIPRFIFKYFVGLLRRETSLNKRKKNGRGRKKKKKDFRNQFLFNNRNVTKKRKKKKKSNKFRNFFPKGLKIKIIFSRRYTICQQNSFNLFQLFQTSRQWQTDWQIERLFNICKHFSFNCSLCN